ncbi:class II fructose-bisphosphate aldolase [Nocardioides sp.]|uniref:class II fructose-bisphosphate aldolase n=1 Tax=Nocardioides sp. TaxID=35761 RepID=UPI00260307F1|nr:class II fructose-bisphosphate aldolase [Nocardioides sp.]MDI6910241.1 class II fructose-bisphosphate aldolase [Nocardioides sp.]
MPLTSTADLVDRARSDRHALGAFNVITLEHAEAIATAAEQTGLPALLQVSENAVAYHGGRLAPLARACVEVCEASRAALGLHLDHVTTEELLHQAPAAGFTSVMFDASRLDYLANVAATRSAARWAHDHGLWFEAELGEVGGKDGAHAPGVRTDPSEARSFVEATEADGLAVAVGSSHAMVHQDAVLDLELIEELARAVPVPLVLHGSSGVPYGQLAQAVTAGITKVNVGTALNIAFTGAVRECLTDDALVDPRRYLALARTAMTESVAAVLTTLSPGTGAG